MIIRTSQDAAAVDCCGCLPPTCAEPRKECESITGTVSSVGHFNPTNTEWIIYLKSGTKSEQGGGHTSVDGNTVYSTSSFESSGTEFAINFSGSVGSGEDCKVWDSGEEDFCDTSGTTTLSYYDGEGEDRELATQYVTTRALLTGETDEHQEWETVHPDPEGEAADYAEALAEYNDVSLPAYNAAMTAWYADYAVWIADGEVGDPPVEPVAPEAPIEPPAEPAENYVCAWEDTTSLSNPNEDPPVFIPDWQVERNQPHTTMHGAPGVDVVYSDVYEGPSTYAEWVEATRAAVLAELDFTNEACITGSACTSSYVVTGEPEGSGSIILSATKARYRFGVPEDFSTTEAPRSTWEMQWDEVFFPTGYDDEIDDPEVTPPDPLPEGWEHPRIADPEAPAPSLVASQEWVWGGSMESPWSPWLEIDVPTEDGETRPVNAMVKCYKSTRLGVKPTAIGEIYPLPE